MSELLGREARTNWRCGDTSIKGKASKCQFVEDAIVSVQCNCQLKDISILLMSWRYRVLDKIFVLGSSMSLV
jgi:hypothetical protein